MWRSSICPSLFYLSLCLSVFSLHCGHVMKSLPCSISLHDRTACYPVQTQTLLDFPTGETQHKSFCKPSCFLCLSLYSTLSSGLSLSCVSMRYKIMGLKRNPLLRHIMFLIADPEQFQNISNHLMTWIWVLSCWRSWIKMYFRNTIYYMV